jgi:hypothetical protein
LGSEPIIYHWDENLGKVWASYDPEPGELPVRQSPFLPTRDGEGILMQLLRSNFFPAIFCRDFLSKTSQLPRIAPISGSYSFLYNENHALGAWFRKA